MTNRTFILQYTHTLELPLHSHTIHENFIGRGQRCFDWVWIKEKCFAEIQKL